MPGNVAASRLDAVPSEYDTVDMAAQLSALERLGHPDTGPAAAAAVVDEAHRWCPAVLSGAAAVLFAAGEREDGAFWFYAAALRARFDARRCTDPSAAAACGALLDAHGPAINRWALRERPGLLPGLVDRVVAWDAATPYAYDHRWIALHGMRAFLGTDEPLATPAAGWAALAADTRAEFAAACRGLFDADGRLRPDAFA